MTTNKILLGLFFVIAVYGTAMLFLRHDLKSGLWALALAGEFLLGFLDPVYREFSANREQGKEKARRT